MLRPPTVPTGSPASAMTPAAPAAVPSLERSFGLAHPKTVVPPCFLNDPAILAEWRSDYTRFAQRLYDHLWLGPMSAALDPAFLEANNITLLLGVAASGTLDGLRPELPAGVEFYPVPVSGPHDYVKFFPHTRQKIDENAARRRGATLVFCESGNDRSAAFAISYVMERSGLDVIQAIQFVQSKRFSVALDDTTVFQLRAYEPLYRARKTVSSCNPSFSISAPTTVFRKKCLRRTLDDIYDRTDQHETRPSIAPFEDRESTPAFDSVDGMQLCV
ncbi:protein-tyrosine phosphatase-like protein [Dipodascopsis tothii]|uniref:protein-tyrosine phosphatase-like protein n=1 Tax=Dipodascopsis tothii TaxID=44089 RepID=UPI0034CE42AD